MRKTTQERIGDIRVFIYEARGVVDLVVDHHVQVSLRRVLGDVGICELFRFGHVRSFVPLTVCSFVSSRLVDLKSRRISS